LKPAIGCAACRRFAATTGALLAALAATIGMSAQTPAPGGAPAPGAPAAGGQFVLATGPGADVFQRVCVLCHTPDRIVANRKTRTEWDEVIDKMITRGAQVTDDNYGPIEEFLLRNYGKVNVNKGAKDDLVLIAGVTPAEADAIIKARTESGPFADFAALGKVPGLDVKKLEDRKDALTF
jgi:competence ComEA-like helix-hairpin-helix protein